MDSVQFFKAMADETRLYSILLIAQEQELCVCELTTALEQSQPKISRHLAQLRQVGLLQDRRQGLWVFYRIHPQLPAWAQQVISVAQQGCQTTLQAASSRLQSMGDDRPERVASCC
ncbi:metalloregulator ArsR/SmtB family transcription factor [uncultured Ferrimonas sp.]|uniref:metalloregulator ArsR/SmtB family transcription factor n=1 Tax=uncultured Ferrimonas sp. TaxID=432640 RepID=UPI002609FE0A|nr:metalloregulator ArsR/SmtB family transcription factor [uncultured Ferrimonas sp.]